MTATLKLTAARLALLHAVDRGEVYEVRQRTATYAARWGGGRVTRDLKPLLADELVHLTDRWDGLTRLYDVTDAGRAILDQNPEG